MSDTPDNLAARERRIVAGISLPLIAAYLAEMGMMITDMIIVGRLGSIELAAVGLAADWFYVLLLIGMGVVSIVSVLAAHARGAGDRRAIGAAVRQGFIAATVLSIPIMLLAWFLAPALTWTGQDERVVASVAVYMVPLTFGVIPTLWFTVLRNYVTAMEHTRSIFIISVAALVLNLGINIVLVHGKFGVPAMGVAGAGLGTTIVSWLMFLTIAALTIARPLHDRLSFLAGSWRPHLATLREIFSLGTPIALTQVLNGGTFTVAAVLVGTISAVELAAMQIMYTVIYLNLGIAEGLGDAARVRVAFGAGRRDVAGIHRSANICLVGGGAICLLLSVLVWLFPEPLVSVFLDTTASVNTEVLAVATGLVIYACLFQWFCTLQIVSANCLRGLKDTRTPLYVSLVAYWLIGLGVGSALCFAFGLGSDGIWAGLLLGVVIGSAYLIYRFFIHVATLRTSMTPTQHA